MLEKNRDLSSIEQIEFNWERVKKKVASKREELVANSPKIIKRELNARSQHPSRETRTSTTDTLTDPYHNIEIQAASKRSDPPGTPITNQNHIDIIDNTDMDNGIDKSEGTYERKGTDERDTDERELLPRLSPGASTPSVCDESLGPDRNAVEILRGIKAKEIAGNELTVDERRLVVKSMKELGQTQDSIADLLKVSRRTIVSDYKVLRQEQALAIQSTDAHLMAGEVYDVAKTCIRRALQAGSFKTVSVIMRDMVEVLQSLGVLYRAPKTSMQATMHGRLNGNASGYQRYMDSLGNDKSKVVEVLDCMFNAIDNDQVSES